MNTWLNVARYQLLDRITYVLVPWAWLAFAFAVDAVVAAMQGRHSAGPHDVWGLIAIYICLFVAGLLSVTRTLPFGLTLGLSRRSFYLGTVTVAVALGATYGLVLAVLQAIERTTNGWGLRMHLFQVPYLLDGPWYVTWLTSFVAITLLFSYGVWFGLVFRRWGVIGVMIFGPAQIGVLVVGAVCATWTHAWHSIGHFFITLSVEGLTGVLAALALALLAAGYSTTRHVTV